LLKKPDYAKHVKVIGTCYGPGSKKNKLDISQADVSIFKATIDLQVFRTVQRREWSKNLEKLRLTFTAVFMLILSQCVRLHTLSISLEHSGNELLWRFMSSTFSQLARLQIMKYLNEHEQHRLHFLTSPKLEILQLVWIPYRYFVSPEVDFQRMAPAVLGTRKAGNLTAFSVLRSRVPVYRLRNVLHESHGLRILELDFLYSTAHYEPIDLNRLSELLGKFHETLVHLVARFDMVKSSRLDTEDVEDAVHGNQKGLQQFTALATLETSLGLIFGENYGYKGDDLTHSLADVLPLNLRKLTIADHLWRSGPSLGTQGMLTMGNLKQYFSWELSAVGADLN